VKFEWRRGLLLAGIHLAVATAMMVWDEASAWQHLTAVGASTQLHLRAAAWQEELSFQFNPCTRDVFDAEPSMPAMIATLANVPVGLITGGHAACSSRSVLDRTVQSRFGRGSRVSELVICALLWVLIPVQWFLVGGFPLVRPKRWWLEPGAFITACTVASAALAGFGGLAWMIHRWATGPIQDSSLSEFASTPAVLVAYVASFAWFWWFGLLVWTVVRFGWRLVRRRSVARAG
jgi:hypothetical protein